MTETLDRLSEQYEASVPSDLRDSRSFEWYLETLYEDPKVARNAHQRLADMFDHYGTTTEDGVVEYELASEDPLGEGANTFFGREVHESIHEFVNKVKSGARGLGPEKRIILLLGPVGSGKSDVDRQVRRYYEDYTAQDDGRLYTFRWTDLCSVIDDQDPNDDTVVSPMHQDPLVLLPQKQRQQVIDDLNEELDAPYSLRNEQALDPESEFYMDELLAHYDDDLQAVLENHVEVTRLVASENRRDCIETFEPKDKKNQDETELTGDVNYSKLAVYGESDPRAFDYAGAFCNANRGIFSGEDCSNSSGSSSTTSCTPPRSRPSSRRTTPESTSTRSSSGARTCRSTGTSAPTRRWRRSTTARSASTSRTSWSTNRRPTSTTSSCRTPTSRMSTSNPTRSTWRGCSAC